jgi:YidC/Oxa1 family membrane protein insertase
MMRAAAHGRLAVARRQSATRKAVDVRPVRAPCGWSDDAQERRTAAHASAPSASMQQARLPSVCASAGGRLGRQQAAFWLPIHSAGAARAFASSSASKAALEPTAEASYNNSGAGLDDFDKLDAATAAASPASVDDTLNRLFAEQQKGLQTLTDSTSPSTGDAWYAAADAASTAASSAAWEPVWYNFADQAVVAVNALHNLTGLEYGWSIVGVTLLFRAALFPLMISARVSSSRMAHLRPELDQMKARFDALGTPSRQEQLQFAETMKALFRKYEVKPMRALVLPIVQIPIFMGMFFGMRKMPSLFPDELSTGGMFWFPDLTVPDPTYILPVGASLSFLVLLEVDKHQMKAAGSGIASSDVMLNVMRLLTLAMVPVAIYFESAVLCYWASNNSITLAQSLLLKSPAIRSRLGIWEPPKPVPTVGGVEDGSLTKSAENLIKRIQGKPVTVAQEIAANNKAVETKRRAQQLLRINKQRGVTGTKNR